MTEYLEHIDTSYDTTFEGIRDLTWWPWVVSRQLEKSYLESVPSSIVGQNRSINTNENGSRRNRCK